MSRSILTIADVFEAVQAHRDLSGVAQVLGAAQDNGTMLPRVVWALAGSEGFEPSILHSRPTSIDGRHVHAEGVTARVASAELRVYVEAGPEPRHLGGLENLLRLLVCTLHEVCRGFGNFRLGSGRSLERESLAEGEIGYILPVQFLCPIFRTLGAADVRSISTLPGAALTSADATTPAEGEGSGGSGAAPSAGTLTGSATAGAALTLGQVVAILSSADLGTCDGTEARANAIVGVSLGAYGSGETAAYAVTGGRVTGLSGLTPGTRLWASTAGALAAWADVPSGYMTRPICVVDTPTSVRVMIGEPREKP